MSFNLFKKLFKKEEIKKIPPSFAKKGNAAPKNKPKISAKEKNMKLFKSNSNNIISKDSNKNNNANLRKKDPLNKIMEEASLNEIEKTSPDKMEEANKDQATLNNSNNDLSYINSVFGKRNNNGNNTSNKESFGFGWYYKSLPNGIT